jgi:hypothetical protein
MYATQLWYVYPFLSFLFQKIHKYFSVLVVHQASHSREQTSLERFLLDQCSKSIRFAIKACWIFQGVVQDRMDGDHNDPVSSYSSYLSPCIE